MISGEFLCYMGTKNESVLQSEHRLFFSVHIAEKFAGNHYLCCAKQINNY